MIWFDRPFRRGWALYSNSAPIRPQNQNRYFIISQASLAIFLIFMLLCFFSNHAQAQCSNSVKLGCGVYTQCFERYCPCSADKNYFTNYGKRYCEKFIGRNDWSTQGVAWRDKTLLCLQEAIIPKLDLDHPEKCDCSKMKDFAFQTHISCYSQNTASICRLPASDWSKIIQTIDTADLLDAYGAKQMLGIVNVCIGQQAGDIGNDIKEKWKQAKEKLSNIIK
ncbi:hypothetical protein ACQKQD_32330 [Methylobacterium sp. NPDC080182]|uniref:hypothetical protein n=1 Tax=Methylobacterium sp. NPDC080182 TaxID=3390590 RepID=UPI003D0470DD